MRIKTLAYIAIGLHFARKILHKTACFTPVIIDYKEGATHWVNVKLRTWDGKEKTYERIMSIPPGKLTKDEMKKILNRLNFGGWKEIFRAWETVVLSASFSISNSFPATRNAAGKDYIIFRVTYGLGTFNRLRNAFLLPAGD